MLNFLQELGLKFESGKIILPDWVRIVKLDVGLSVNAPQSELWLQNNSETLVFGFEPVSSNLAALKAGNSTWPIKLNPERIGDTMIIIPCALGSRLMSGLHEIHITAGDSGRSSLLRPVNFSVIRKEKIEVFLLSDFLELFPFHLISSIDHLKIDVQGLDFEVLRGTNKFLRNISAVTVEVDQTDYENTTNNFKKIRFYMLLFGHIYVRNKLKWNKCFKILRLQIQIDSHDPTFVNIFHIHKFRRRQLSVIQIG